MEDEVKPTRSWWKCSACRERKIKCEPDNRNWEENKEKCLSCEERGEECSQNYKKKDDPRPRLASSATAGGLEGHSRSTIRASTVRNIAAAPAILVVAGAGKPQLNGSGLEHRRSSDGEDHGDPSLRLNRLNALGALSNYFVSHLAILSKQGYCSTGPYNELNNLSSLVKDEFHSLFIQLVDAGLEAEDLAKANPIRSQSAHIIFQSLLFALAICAGPCDERKRHALLKTASYFQRHGYIYEGEHILAKLAEIKHLHLPHQQNPCLLLAQSLAKSSESAGLLLADVWLKGYGQGDVPPHLVLPPSQRAALHSNKYVALEVLSNPTNINSPPDILAQHELHIAAALGLTEKLNGYIEANPFVDPQDAFLRTPLFVAAMHGQDEACLALIRGFANTSIRDIRGRTVLEVAAQGGRLSTVRQLVERGADINPLGGSTPLHAAIEGNNIEVVHYLLESNALVGIQRPHDRKTAINLAEDRGWPCLAQYMLQKLQYQTGPQDEQPFAPSMDWQLFSPSLF